MPIKTTGAAAVGDPEPGIRLADWEIAVRGSASHNVHTIGTANVPGR
jgi:hypothetical protein